MGREVKKVDKDFDWREKTKNKEGYCQTWKGYTLGTELLCFLCDGTGKNLKGKDCSLCLGDKKVLPKVDPPLGDYYQIWEDVSEGSPVSPPFKTPEQLAKWMVNNDKSSATAGTSYEAWLRMIKEEGSAPSGVISNKGWESGVEAIYKKEKK